MTVQRDRKPIPHYAKFMLGGISGMGAGLCVHPMDFMKTRMQMTGRGTKQRQYSTTLDVVSKIRRNEGVFAFYNGVSASLVRHATYSTTRLGIYTVLFETFSTLEQPPSFAVKAAIGTFSGVCGGFVGTPADLCLVRLMSDGGKHPSERFNYKHVFDALLRIIREEGVLRLWKGGTPTILRAAMVNGTSLAMYSQTKRFLLSTRYFADDVLLYFTCSTISGFISAVTTLPVDIVKTRLQSARKGEKMSGIGTVFMSILRKEGVFAFWKGFTPYFARFAPSTALTLILMETLTHWYEFYILGNQSPRGSL